MTDQPAGPDYDTRYARSSQPIIWAPANWWRWRGHRWIAGPPEPEPGDILDRIDQALAHSYDAQTSTGQPWPFRGF